jgi:hypothetical protein
MSASTKPVSLDAITQAVHDLRTRGTAYRSDRDIADMLEAMSTDRSRLIDCEATIATLREAMLRPKDKTDALRADAEEDAAELQVALKDLLRVAEATAPHGHPSVANARALVAKIEG